MQIRTNRNAGRYAVAILAVFVLAPSAAVQAADTSARVTSSAKTDGFPSYFPPFSWATVPVYQQFSDPDHLLTDAEVAQIASTSDFICIEKDHGLNVLGAADLGTKHEIPRFKALKPRMKILFYFNSAYAYPFDTYSKVFRYGEVRGKYKSFLLKNPKTGALYFRHRDHVYFFNVLNPEFRTWWADAVGKYVSETGADGLFVDQMHGFAYLRPKQRKEVAQAQAELMRRAKAAIGADKIMLLNNGAGIPDLLKIGDGFMFEHAKPSWLTKEAIVQDWALMKKISQAGKFAVWRIGVKGGKRTNHEALSHKEISYYLAAFLIGAQPYSYFQYGWGWRVQTGPLVVYPDFQRRLGKPLGDYTRPDPNGWIFQREFEHASVWLDLDKREGKIQWK